MGADDDASREDSGELMMKKECQRIHPCYGLFGSAKGEITIIMVLVYIALVLFCLKTSVWLVKFGIKMWFKCRRVVVKSKERKRNYEETDVEEAVAIKPASDLATNRGHASLSLSKESRDQACYLADGPRYVPEYHYQGHPSWDLRVNGAVSGSTDSPIPFKVVKGDCSRICSASEPRPPVVDVPLSPRTPPSGMIERPPVVDVPLSPESPPPGMLVQSPSPRDPQTTPPFKTCSPTVDVPSPNTPPIQCNPRRDPPSNFREVVRCPVGCRVEQSPASPVESPEEETADLPDHRMVVRGGCVPVNPKVVHESMVLVSHQTLSAGVPGHEGGCFIVEQPDPADCAKAKDLGHNQPNESVFLLFETAYLREM